jgi:hypothetical protein
MSGPVPAGCETFVVKPSVDEVVEAIVASWSPDTADPTTTYLAAGRPGQQTRGQCGTTALVIQDWLGGDLIIADVLIDGTVVGVHYWNRLPDGTELDLTGDQFLAAEMLTGGQVVVRPAGPPSHGLAAYLLLARRVDAILERRRCAGGGSSEGAHDDGDAAPEPKGI